jgi:hypothetical protein
VTWWQKENKNKDYGRCMWKGLEARNTPPPEKRRQEYDGTFFHEPSMFWYLTH